MVTYHLKKVILKRITYKPTDNCLVFRCRALLLLLYTVVLLQLFIWPTLCCLVMVSWADDFCKTQFYKSATLSRAVHTLQSAHIMFVSASIVMTPLSSYFSSVARLNQSAPAWFIWMYHSAVWIMFIRVFNCVACVSFLRSLFCTVELITRGAIYRIEWHIFLVIALA